MRFCAHPSLLLRRGALRPTVGPSSSSGILASSSCFTMSGFAARHYSQASSYTSPSSSSSGAPLNDHSGGGGADAELGAVALAELHKEVLRDEGEGLKSVPPEVPPGWRAVHEPRSRWMILRKLHASQPQQHDGGGALPAEERHGPTASNMQYKGYMNRGRPMAAAQGGSGGSGSSKVKRSPLLNGFWSGSVPTATASPMDVELYVPFATHDPSLLDNSIDVCEWQPFDVVCSKGGGGAATALVLHLAAVNSQVRVRGIQCLTRSAAREIGSTDGSIGVFGGYGPAADYRRRLAYQGPMFTNLSAELKACVHDFISHDVGIDDLMLEYIMQATYLAENEEYQRWLHDLSSFAGVQPTAQ